VERPPIIDGNVARFKLLLGDIRDVFTKQDNAPISSVELVKALAAIEGRPWSAAANKLFSGRGAQLQGRATFSHSLRNLSHLRYSAPPPPARRCPP
jgi:hypothetical protein